MRGESVSFSLDDGESLIVMDEDVQGVYVLQNHDVPVVERVVDANERYVIVETFGEAGITAIKLDPRRRG